MKIYLQGTFSAFTPGKPPLWPPIKYVPKPGVMPGAHGTLPILLIGRFAHLAAHILTAIAIKNIFYRKFTQKFLNQFQQKIPLAVCCMQNTK